ncbi:putative pentatricopeptide repeat-containing protein At5g37570 [Aristolochia californica]|uniref:putative pentatricopeptide repeat-containing protein At5g37570 n=1 Tax=Aristolochia californica TaxID=171875 RepID=UPI0035DE53C3
MSFIHRSSSLKWSNKTPIRSVFLFLSFQTLFDACNSPRNLREIHAHIVLKGVEQDNFLITRFVCICNSYSNFRYAARVFDRVDEPNIYLWNSIIKGCSENSLLLDTILLFKRMRKSQTTPDRYTFPSLLKACSLGLALREGLTIHCAVVRLGVASDIFVQTGLIDFYGKCGEIASARKVFDGMYITNEVSWTALIAGYTSLGDLGAARTLFDKMPNRNTVTWNVMIDGYAKCGDLTSARKLFDEMPSRNVVSFTSLINGYAKAGDMASARYLFDLAPDRDIVSWTALISGYAQNGRPYEAIKIFQDMYKKNIKPDEFIMVSLMSACAEVGSLDFAKWVDNFLVSSAIGINQAYVIAALIHMNAKCGNMYRAVQLFEEMPKKDLFTYCSVIQGLSIHGQGGEGVTLFSRMLEEGLVPDEVAFTVVLTACTHAGLVEEGCRYFHSMQNDYSIIPSPDHYACMVDLFGRAGYLKEAYYILRKMPVEQHVGAWGAMLGACNLHGDIELSKIVASHLFEIEPHNAGNYVLLSNIHAAADQWLEVWDLRNAMTERGIRKVPGCSWVSPGSSS